MNCPKCKHPVAKDADVCLECNYVLIAHGRSALAIWTFILGLLSPILSIFTALPALITGTMALRRIRRSHGLLRGKWLARTGLFLSGFGWLTFALLLLWLQDAPPIENDFTVADLRSARPEYNYTWELLQQFDESTGAMGLTQLLAKPLPGDPGSSVPSKTLSAPGRGFVNPDAWPPEIDEYAQVVSLVDQIDRRGWDAVQDVLARYEAQIEEMWRQSTPAREVVVELTAAEYIADLTEMQWPPQRWSLRPLSQLHDLCAAAVCLDACRGEYGRVEEFLQFDRLHRKTLLHARTSMTDMICRSRIYLGRVVAAGLASDPNCPPECLMQVKSVLTPLTPAERSMRNSILGTYLVQRDMLTHLYAGQGEDWFSHLGARRVAFEWPLLKPNSTLRACRNQAVAAIAASEQGPSPEMLNVWPSFSGFLNLPRSEDLNWYGRPIPRWYFIYNAGGGVLCDSHWRSSSSLVNHAARATAADDLFQIVIACRLGEPYSLKARAWSKEYVIDRENRVIYSPGPDAIALTRDDVRLPCNPDLFPSESADPTSAIFEGRNR